MPGESMATRLAARLPAFALGTAASLAVVLLFLPWITAPQIRYDDFNFLTKSRTWADTGAHLFLPMNEHVMPLARAGAGVLMQLTPRQSSIPLAAEIHGILAVVAGMWLLFQFVRRELGHDFYGVVAMTLWGVTTTYYECVTWYSASFFTLALDTMLVGLLAAQAFRRGGRPSALALCGVCCALAPAFHSTGLIGGLCCALYLGSALFEGSPDRSSRLRTAAAAAVPLLGTVAFVAFGFLVASGEIVHAEHYRGKTIFAAFDPIEGLRNSVRTLADNQILGAFGWWDKTSVFSWRSALGVVAASIGLGALWWRIAPNRRLLLVGVALILGSNFLVYGARADWSYERTVHNWTRYHLFPHLGIVLFVAGGLPAFEGRWIDLTGGKALSRGQFVGLAALIAVMLGCHWPRSRGSHFIVPPEQASVLQRVERVDAYCRAFDIDGATARDVLEFVQFPLGYDRENAWEFLRGSRSPRPMPAESVRELLAGVR
jgi:hypothetical protein